MFPGTDAFPIEQAMARYNSETDTLDGSADDLGTLSICDTNEMTEGAVAEEEEYVKAMLDRSLALFEEIKQGKGGAEAWASLEKDMVLEFEYTSWPVLSDASINTLIKYLLDVLVTAEEAISGKGKSTGLVVAPAISAAIVDCAYAVIDVYEGMMEARFIKYLGEDLERPFDEEGSLAMYRGFLVALRLVVTLLSKDIRNEVMPKTLLTTHSSQGGAPALVEEAAAAGAAPALSLPTSSPSQDHPLLAPHEKVFTLVDDEGRESTTSKLYDPLQYLLTVLYLLSHTAVQTDVTCFWWNSETVIEELWSDANLKVLLQSMECAIDRLEDATDSKDRALFSVLIDRWTHTLHGALCTDSIGRVMSPTVPDEEHAGEGAEKPGIEALTGVSTYLGRWMDVRCLPCSCHFCGVQKQAMNAMMSKWDKRLAHRLIEINGLTTIGRVSYWLLENFRSIESTGDVTGEDLYRTDVALNTQIVHLCVLSDYDCATMAEEQTLRARAVKQAIDSGFLNFLLNYFIPRKLCRLEDPQSESTEDMNKARRLARISCKNCIEFLLLSGDGWITDTCYNARDCAKIESDINVRMAPAAQRLIELWTEDQRVCTSIEDLLDHYAPFFLKLCEIIRLSTRYGWMKDLWSSELLEGAVSVMSNFTLLKFKHGFEGSLPSKKTLLCTMATFCDMCSPCFGARDHFMAASRAVHDCEMLKELLEAAKSSKAATSCIRALSYVSRVELVMSVSTKNSARPEQHRVAVCNQCHRPPTLERPLRQCGRCKKVYYCCIDCQRQNWKDHESYCAPEADECHKRVKRGSRDFGRGGGISYVEEIATSPRPVGTRGAAGPLGGQSPTSSSLGGHSPVASSSLGGRTPTASSSSAAEGGGGYGCAQCEMRPQSDRQLMTCGRCRDVYYCSKECQMKHWNSHRKQCGPNLSLQPGGTPAGNAASA